MKPLILFPSDYFDSKKPDEDLKKEYDAAKETGLFDIVIFDYDSWFNDGRLKLTEALDEKRFAIYRGWMMRPEMYEKFYKMLLDENIHLISDPLEYERFHAFPNAYEFVKEDTAKMIVFPEGTKVDAELIRKSFDRFMIKDYVKSVKGSQFPKFFEKGITQSELDSWLEVFRNFRGDLYTGGICIKEFLDLKTYGDKTNEYRAFYEHGNIVSVSRNSNQDEFADMVPKSMVEKYANLPGNFYTVDFAQLEDGDFIVIETGDGQVSGLSTGQDYEAFFRALYYARVNIIHRD